jgi:hypothetical protein
MNLMIIEKRQFHNRVEISPIFQTEFSAKQAGYDIKKLHHPIKYHFKNGFILKERYIPDKNNYDNVEIREKRIECKDIDVYVYDFIHLLEFEQIK